MTKRIEAYFTSENDAMSAESSLQRFPVSDALVDTLPEQSKSQTFLPIYALGSTSGGTGTNGAGGVGIGTFGWIEEKIDDEGKRGMGDSEETMTHMLEFELADDANLEEIVKVLKEHNGYMLKHDHL